MKNKRIFLISFITIFFLTSCFNKKHSKNTETQNLDGDSNHSSFLSGKNLNFWTARSIPTDHKESILFLDISPDGSELLYTTRNESNSFIYIMDTHTKLPPRVIHKDERSIAWAKFNHSDNSILFSTKEDNGSFYLSSLNISGNKNGLPSLVYKMKDIDICESSYNQNGFLAMTQAQKVQLNESSKMPEIKSAYAIVLKKDDITLETIPDAKDHSWSKDGKSMTLVSKLFGNPEICIWNENERGLRRVTVSNTKNKNPAFSPDNQWIIYSSNRDGKFDLYITSLHYKKTRKITSMSDMEFYRPAWSADGSIYCIGGNDKRTFIFHLKPSSKIFDLHVEGEPGPSLSKVKSPIEIAQRKILLNQDHSEKE